MGYGAKTVPATSGGIVIIAANKARTGYKIYHNGTNPVYIGTDVSVTAANGYVLKADKEFTEYMDADRDAIDRTIYTGNIYGIVASGTENEGRQR